MLTCLRYNSLNQKDDKNIKVLQKLYLIISYLHYIKQLYTCFIIKNSLKFLVNSVK